MFAQLGDLTVRFDPEARFASPERVTYSVRVGWTGVNNARDVKLTMNVPGAVVSTYSLPGPTWACTTSGEAVECTVPSWSSTRTGGVAVSVQVPASGTYTATASIATVTPEETTANNTAAHTVEVAGLPALRVNLTSRDESVDPGGVGTIDLSVQNSADAAANVVMRAKIEGGAILSAKPMEWGFGEPTAVCAIAGDEVECRIPRMAAFNSFELVRLTYRVPDRREGGKVVATATVASDRPNYDSDSGVSTRTEVTLRRIFTVTSAEDAGAGTLRQAIVESLPACEKTPCTIAFEGVSLIQPASALPALRGLMRIDGRDSRVTLDGSQLAAGDGLLFAGGCGIEIWNLEIRNFPGHGIEARQIPSDRDGCSFSSIGVFVRHAELSGNERGIVAKGIDASLKENFVHDQRRAGIFIDGSYYSEIYNNVVVNNGASGIFVNTSTEPQFGGIPPGADLVENVVHGNGEWGIARTRNGLVQMRRNSTARNGLYGVDVGLDLSTPNRAGNVTGVPNKPVLESAAYDPATNTTIIRIAESGGWIDFYASTSLSRYGYPESEIYLASVLRNGAFEQRVAGDLRGMWITATSSHSQTLYFLRGEQEKTQAHVGRPPSGYDTSELSDPVRVQ
ncbi:MAG TPA: right-handed parallel beta-helix repeat-containing protein [Thermoanaerobaculia bacterium]|nr:right-handed parallel beta-helix repeat-containing protein [Thermoanaerobaculia bacterium]